MFDPYHRWLAIPPDQRPPTYYQLLGIAPTESDPEVIKEAALRQVSHVRGYQTGQYAQQCTTLLNELGLARATLLNPEKRREYDAQRAISVPKSAMPPPLPAPAPESLEFAPPSPLRERPNRHEKKMAGAFWTHPAIYLYLALLCLGVGLGFAVTRTAPKSDEPASSPTRSEPSPAEEASP